MARPFAVLATCLVGCLLASCGGGGDDAKPDAAGGDAGGAATHAAAVKLIKSSTTAKANSGVVDGQVEIALKGVPEFSEPFSTSISGAFQYRTGAALPEYQLDLGARDYGVTLTSVDGKSYVTVGTTAYELPHAIRNRLVRNSGAGVNGLTKTLQQFGVRPWVWETEERVAGTETIDGVKTTHLKTSFNAGRMLHDALTLLGVLRSLGITRATGLPPTISHSARRLFVSAITSKMGQSWFGVSDHIRRKSGFVMKISVPKAKQAELGGITGGTVTGGLRVTDVGKPQKIRVPTELGSYADFQLALDALGDAQEAK
jgi:hypothetical protein